MNTLSLQHLDIRQDETLIVAFHKKSREWWACIGRDHGPQRAIGKGDTPIAAFADMLLDLGHAPTSAN